MKTLSLLLHPNDQFPGLVGWLVPRLRTPFPAVSSLAKLQIVVVGISPWSGVSAPEISHTNNNQKNENTSS
jgi:hypothetical protein